MDLIIKFYYCDKCGLYEEKNHPINHFGDEEYNGYQVFYNKNHDNIYIHDTYSSFNSVLTDDTFDDWIYEGSKDELCHLIKNNLDLEMNTRIIDEEDYNYKQIKILYNKLKEYFNF